MPALVGSTFMGFSGYAVLLPVAPLWAVHGGADEGGAGLVNGVLLLFTVLTQFTIPGALRRFGWGPVLAAGLVLLGLPAVAFVASDALMPVLLLSAIRGVGFGILTVAGSAAVAELSDPHTRGAAVGVYGLAVAGPQVFLLPLGPWIAEMVNFTIVFLIAAVPLLGIPPALRLGAVLQGQGSSKPDSTEPRGPEPAAMSTPRAVVALLRPMTLLLGVTLAGGAIISFAPQMIDDPLVAAVALALLGTTSAITRWGLGPLGDRYGPRRFIWLLVLVTVASMTLAALAVGDMSSVSLFLVSCALLGCAYGGQQNLTLVVALSAVTRRHYGLASAMWNIGFDLGSGLGSVLVGAIAMWSGFPAALLATAAVAILTLPLALWHVSGEAHAKPQ